MCKIISEHNDNFTIHIKFRFKTFNEVEKFKERIKGLKYEVISKIYNKAFYDRKEARLKKILENMSSKKEYRIGQLYRFVFRKMFNLSYKTFQRDISTLILKGELTAKIINKGINGRSTVIQRR